MNSASDSAFILHAHLTLLNMTMNVNYHKEKNYSSRNVNGPIKSALLLAMNTFFVRVCVRMLPTVLHILRFPERLNLCEKGVNQKLFAQTFVCYCCCFFVIGNNHTLRSNRPRCFVCACLCLVFFRTFDSFIFVGL